MDCPQKSGRCREVAFVKRFYKSQCIDCPQKSGRCREGAIVEKKPLVEIWVYKMIRVAIV